MVVVLYFFGRNLDWGEVRSGLAKANKGYLALAFLGICFGYFIRAVRWQVLLKPITGSRLHDLFATTTVGFAAILIVGRAGEIVRPMWLPMRDRRIRPSSAFVTIVIERILDLASVMVFFSVSLIWFRIPPEHADQFAYIKLVGNVLSALILVGIIGLIVYHRYSAGIIGFFARLTDRKFVPVRLRKLFLSVLEKLAASLDILQSPVGVFLSIFWTAVLWLSIAIPTWLILLAFGLTSAGGQPMTFLDSTFVMAVATLSSLAPTPGGAAGAFHYATAFSLILLGVDENQAKAAAIMAHLIYFVPALMFGLYYLFHGDISVERFRSLLSSENAEREIETDSPDFVPET
ncbi:hypothetical protein BH10ACI3_BH10ACI3_11300 [soil metagenome]